ncbi:SGNH/GDSL hydrolase family protein [Fastidiosibacter lacustris]|uniref:SGNH/GDSL hydrolase family protein n=1 Tax=Fastidiosibacter lacustris TaxID=2056695 RepID=UPI000E3574E8|nr:SGNH/GDSL hydrolase family protein [Fastidiosibacter lacustris]
MKIGSIVVFGDSLQDNGNVVKTLGIPGEPYDRGRFCNGLVACEHLADMIKQRQGAAAMMLTNYAIGGAYTTGKNPKSLLTDHAFSVCQQIDRFVALEGRFQHDSLVMINGGGNNFLFAIHNEKPYFNLPAVYRVASDLVRSVDRIVKLGARNIVVWNVPDVTVAPAYKVIPLPGWLVVNLKKYIKKHIVKENKKLSQGILELQKKYPDVQIRLFDAYSFLHEALDSPLAFGFEDAVEACVKSFGGVDAKGEIQKDISIEHDPQTYLFWDYVHPTAKAQKMLAERIFTLIYPL